MARSTFMYVTFIRTTPDKLWQALTDPAFTRRYWNATFETDWKPGSPMIWDLGDGVRVEDPEQVVLEAEPYRRLSFTWHTFTPELNDSHGFAPEVREGLAREPRSRATFTLEPAGEQVKLTVVHEGLEPDGVTVTLISNGWPRVLSGLKTLLETGDVPPWDAR